MIQYIPAYNVVLQQQYTSLDPIIMRAIELLSRI